MTLLSICVPTYNRADMLAYCLDNLRTLDAHGIAYEIIVVDHASTDHTPQVMADATARWGNVRYYRQARQVGIERQFNGCFRMGRGLFTVYVADDDKIIPEALVAHLRYLEANPQLSAVYAPWLAYDDAEEKILHGYFEVPQRVTFSAKEPLALVDFLTQKMVFPECAIYRSEALHATLVSRNDGPYQSFLLLHALLRRGDIAFVPEPFYLEVARTKPQFTPTPRMSVEINLTYLENIRGAAEIMIERMLLDLGADKIPDSLRASVHESLLNYSHHRLIAAFRRALIAGHHVQASELAQRLMLWRGIFQPDLAEIGRNIYALTGVEAAANLANSKTWLTQIYIHGFNRTQDVIATLRRTLPDIAITGADAATILADTKPEQAMVLVKYPADRTAFLGSALLPGNILALNDLARYYQIIPATLSLDAL